jgi:hypothetical protein
MVDFMNNISNELGERANTGTMQLSKSAIFETLQNDRRRHMLQILRKRGSQNIHSLTEEIIRLEEGNESDSDFLKSVHNSLLQKYISIRNLNLI